MFLVLRKLDWLLMASSQPRHHFVSPIANNMVNRAQNLIAGKNKIVCHIAAGKTMEQFLCREVNKQKKNIKSVHTPVTPKPIFSIALAQWDSREFKKLRRQLQRKRHIKIELCVK